MRSILFSISLFLCAFSSNYDPCNVTTSCKKNFVCTSLPDKELPECLPENKICEIVCNSPDCLMMESYPVQIACENKVE